MVYRINKRKALLYSAIAANLGIGGYLLRNHIRKKQTGGKKSSKKTTRSTQKTRITKRISSSNKTNNIINKLKNFAKNKKNTLALLLGLGVAGGLIYKKIRDKIQKAKILEGLEPVSQIAQSTSVPELQMSEINSQEGGRNRRRK